MVSAVYSAYAPRGTSGTASSTERISQPPNMDAHLIGIDLTQLLLKQNPRAEKQRSVKAAQPAAESAIGAKVACAESR